MIFNITPLIGFAILTFTLAPINSFASQSAGKTLMARGDVIATSSNDSESRKLKRRAPVFLVDTINTAEQSQAQLRMSDGGLIALKAQTQLKISDYKFDGAESGGSVVMELVSGGLRTITGKIKGNNGNYKLKTPVGSIGIRGTHYEVEWYEGALYVAVWDGTIELNNDFVKEPLLLGQGGDFSFAKIDLQGEVTELLEPPQQLSSLTTSAQSSESENKEILSQIVASSSGSQLVEPTQISLNIPAVEKVISDTSWLNEESLDQFGSENTPELIAQRTGTANYNFLERAEVISSAGSVTDIDISMTVNFDTGTVPLGEMSFNDAQGEWFAVFNGLINQDGMALGINYASHGQQRASGNINAQFSDELKKVRGNFNLFEINNPTVNANGLFVLGER